MSPGSGVGTLSEKPLHAAIKAWYARPGDLVEHPVDGFIIDLVRDHLLIEVQTRNFSAIKRKLRTLLPSHAVRLVHPIPSEKWIIKQNDDGGYATRRRSPKRGGFVDVFAELVSFPRLIAEPGLSVQVLLTSEEEERRHEPGKAWRRNGWVVQERRLLEVRDSRVFETPQDLARLLPSGLADEFTTAELAEQLARPRRLAQQMVYCLKHAGALGAVDKIGNAVVYSRVPVPPSPPVTG